MSSEKKTTGRGLALKTGVVSGMTLLSRILGLVRDVVFARVFGASLVMDAFLVAQRIPNMLRRFFAEGAFSAGFVPVMARYRENHSEQETRAYLDAMAGTFAVVLFVVTLIGVIASPLIVLLVAPGFVSDGGDFELASLMLRFTFPYLLFVSLTAFAGGILNTYGRFGVPAFTPVILNVVLIVAALYVAPNLQQPVMALAYAVFVAGILQLLFQLPFLRHIRALPRPRWAPKNEGVRRAFKLMLPALFGSSVSQINVLVGGIVASLLPVGSISYLYYSDRLMEFPLGLFGIALATVTLPYLSRLWAGDKHDAFSATLDWSIRLALLIAIPACVALVILATPLVVTLFHGGEFNSQAVAMTVLALKAYAMGLLGFSLVKVLAPAYFAREDTRTPVRVGIIALGVNLVVGIALAIYLTRAGYDGPHVALAFATSVAAVVNAGLLLRGLLKHEIWRPKSGWAALLLRIGVANIAMGGVLLKMNRSMDWWLDSALGERAIWLTVLVIVGISIYFLSLLALGMRLRDFRLARSELQSD